jgi:hypothetical protein
VQGAYSGKTAFGLALLCAAALAGCEPAPPPDRSGEAAPPLAADFEPAAAAEVRGRVAWEGEAPEVSPFRGPISPLSEQPGGKVHDWPNPNAPAVSLTTGAVAGAVVFLRGVEPRKARPWDWPAVRVEMRDWQFHVRQGDADSRTGFVRRGEAVEIVSEEQTFHSVQARGAAFFALAFPDRDQPCVRRLTRPGVVELSSPAGYFWMRAHLLVADHPYYARTDADGRFTLPRVPPGDYEAVCWLPDWRTAERELDGDTGLVTRLTFRPPAEVARPVRVRPGRPAEVSFVLSQGTFGR